MSKIKWDHLILNKHGKIVFSGPVEACLNFYYAGSGGRYGWVIKKDMNYAN